MKDEPAARAAASRDQQPRTPMLLRSWSRDLAGRLSCTCPCCRNSPRVTRAGTLAVHTGHSSRGYHERCSGSGTPAPLPEGIVLEPGYSYYPDGPHEHLAPCRPCVDGQCQWCDVDGAAARRWNYYACTCQAAGHPRRRQG